MRNSENLAKYGCCCQSMHVVAGARTVAMVEIAATILSVLLLIIFYNVFDSDTYAYQLLVSNGSLITGLVCCFLSIVAILTLFAAMRAENPSLVLCHFGAQIGAQLLITLAAVSALITLIGWGGGRTMFGATVYLKSDREGRVSDQYAAQTSGPVVASLVLILSTAGFFLNAWFMIVIFKLYNFYKSRSKF